MLSRKLYRFTKNKVEKIRYGYYLSRFQAIPFSHRGKTYFLNPEQSANYHIKNSISKIQRMVDAIPSPPDCVIDIGANCGLFSALVEQHFPHSKVYAFEPSAELIPIIQRNCKNTIIEPIAVGEHKGNAILHINPQSQQTNSLSLDAVQIFTGTNSITQKTVPVISLDEYCTDQSIRTIDILKIDVQGFEGSVLRGAKKILNKTTLVFLESTWMDLSSIDSLIPFAQKYGFSHIGVVNSVFLGADILLSRTPFADNIDLVTQFSLNPDTYKAQWF